MISDIEIWRTILLMVKKFGEDATVQAAMRVDQFLTEGDVEGCATWKRIKKAVEDLHAGKPTNELIN